MQHRICNNVLFILLLIISNFPVIFPEHFSKNMLTCGVHSCTLYLKLKAQVYRQIMSTHIQQQQQQRPFNGL